MVADISQEKLDTVEEYGADTALLWKKKYADKEAIMDEIARVTKNNTISYAATLDFVGSSDSVMIGHKILGTGGSLVVLGLYQGQLEMQLVDLIRKELHVHGNRTGSLQDLKDMTELLSRKVVKYPAIELVKLQDINEVHKALRNGTIRGRAVIDYVSA